MVAHHQEGWAPAQSAGESLLEALGIQRGQALVEDDELGPLQERAGHEDAAAPERRARSPHS